MGEIKKPWEEGACHECTHCYDDDMCSAYRLIASNVFCPHVRGCGMFKKKDTTDSQKDTIVD